MKQTRRGPRPLPIYLAAAAAISATSAAAWPMLRGGWTPWKEDLAKQGRDLIQDLKDVDPEAFSSSLIEEIFYRNDNFLAGIEKYRAHPFVRDLESPPPIWQIGPVQLQDFGATDPSGKAGKPVLIIPSLINRGYIMDLTSDRSFLRYMASRGLRPLFVDWGTPDQSQLAQTMDDCIAGTLSDILDVAVQVAAGKPVPVMGYCMGGTLATGLAILEPEKFSGLILLAAPWDFHAGSSGPPQVLINNRPTIEKVISLAGCLPVDAIQTLFFALDPVLCWNKYRSFSDLDDGSKEAMLFVALEDWLNDGINMASEIARTCLFEWYGENSPAAGAWKVAGTDIDPAHINKPTLGVLPANDRIVPPASAAALVNAISGADRLDPLTGHIGMMVGGEACTEVWKPVADWIEAL